MKGPEDENWILAEVVAYNSVTGKYDVDDIDEEQKDRHTLSKRLAWSDHRGVYFSKHELLVTCLMTSILVKKYHFEKKIVWG